MSFTFDDVEKPLSVSNAAQMERLSARIAELQSRGATRPEISAKIAGLEKRREQLLNKAARGLKPIQLGGRAAEDGAGEGKIGDLETAKLKMEKKNGFQNISFGRRR